MPRSGSRGATGTWRYRGYLPPPKNLTLASLSPETPPSLSDICTLPFKPQFSSRWIDASRLHIRFLVFFFWGGVQNLFRHFIL